MTSMAEALLSCLNIDIAHVINIYIVGSKMFQVKRHAKSDDDYVIVLDDSFDEYYQSNIDSQLMKNLHKTVQPLLACPSWQQHELPSNGQEGHNFTSTTTTTTTTTVHIPIYEYRSEAIDVTLYTRENFVRSLHLFDSTIVECASLHYYDKNDSIESSFILLRREEFRVPDVFCTVEGPKRLAQLRTSFSQKSGNSYVKAKKKLVVERTVADQLVGYKSLYHSLRLSVYAIQVATVGYVNDFRAPNTYYDQIVLPFSQQQHCEHLTEEQGKQIWTELEKRFRSAKNKLASELRHVAPLLENRQKQR